MAEDAQTGEGGAFEREVVRLRKSGALGEGGRLLELFDFLAARGEGSPSASQAEIAETVFGQADAGADDATVRVYIHRLRKRLDDHYQASGRADDLARLTLPAGTYALRLRGPAPAEAPAPDQAVERRSRFGLPLLAAAALLLATGIGGFFIGGGWAKRGDIEPNAIWQPLLASQRPTVVVAGDYYIYGEIDPLEPEQGRLIRDFRVDSPSDLVRMQELAPERYGQAEDMGLNYLPFSAAYAVADIVPLLKRHGREVRVLPASALTPDLLNQVDIVYVGLLSGMHLLEEINFDSSDFRIGMNYDELIDSRSEESYISGEAHSRPSPAYYDDYGYMARFRAPSGALVYIVAGERDTGLRGIAPILAEEDLPGPLEKVAAADDFEALFRIKGQQGADLSESLLVARKRPDQR